MIQFPFWIAPFIPASNFSRHSLRTFKLLSQEAERLTVDLHPSLLHSPFVFWPAVSSPALYQTTCRGLPFCYASISKWSCRCSPPASLLIHPVILALKSSRNSGNLLTKPVREGNGPTEQVVCFRSSLSHLFSIFKTPNSISNSVAHYLLWPLLILWPHSQETKQILIEHLAFLPPMDSLTTPTTSSPLISVSSQCLETHLIRNPWYHTWYQVVPRYYSNKISKVLAWKQICWWSKSNLRPRHKYKHLWNQVFNKDARIINWRKKKTKQHIQ